MSTDRARTADTLLAITTGLVVLGLTFGARWCFVVAAIAGGIGLLSPALSGWIAQGWSWLGAKLGWINGRILLGLVFFVVLTPVALLRRLLAKRSPDHGTTYWTARDHRYTAADLEKPW